MDSLDERSETDDALTVDSELLTARHDIERTRANMGETLSAIREKLNPQQLMDQAKSTVLEATTSMTDKAKTSLLEVTDGMKNDVHTMVTDVSDHAKGAAKDAATGAVSGAVEEVRNTVGAAIDSTKKASSNVMEIVNNNPIATVVLVGAGWYILSHRRPATLPMGPGSGVGSVLDAAMHNPIPAALVIGTALHLYHNHENGNGKVNGPDYHVAKTLGDKASAVVAGAKETLSQAVDSAKETLSNTGNTVKESASKATDAAGALASSVGERVKHAENGLMKSVHANPLAVGLCALGVGAAIALMLPDTEPENQFMGGARDNLMETAQQGAGKLLETVHDASTKLIETVGESSQREPA